MVHTIQQAEHSKSDPNLKEKHEKSLSAALTNLAHGRNESAWNVLLTIVGDDILRLSRGILGDYALAEDAAQETLLRIRDQAKLNLI